MAALLVFVAALTLSVLRLENTLAQGLTPIHEELPINRDLKLSRLKEFGFSPSREEGREGLDLIFNGNGFWLFVPESLFKLLTVSASRAEIEQRRQWIVYGNPPSPRSRTIGGKYEDGQDVGLNYSVRQVDGERYVAFSCFQCHAGMVAGTLVAGLGNAHLDQTSLVHHLHEYRVIREFYVNNVKGSLSQSLVDFLSGITEVKRKHLMNFSLYSETVLLPALQKASSRGDDYGPYPVWQLLARLKDPAQNGFELYPIGSRRMELLKLESLIREAAFGPVDRRPWWLRKHDTKSYVYGDTLASPDAGKDFAVNFTVPHFNMNASYGKRSHEISSILQFALHTKAPPYPRPIRWDLVEQGHKLYEEKCSRCHGSFVPNTTGSGERWILKYRSMKYQGDHPRWKGRTLPEILYTAGSSRQGDQPVDPEWTADTDLTYSHALQIWGGVDPKSGQRTAINLIDQAKGLRLFFKQWGLSENRLPSIYSPAYSGYRAPPLVGIWASAPYLHNGSVPTLRDLFEYFDVAPGENARPPIWARVFETEPDLAYDFQNVGLKVEFPAQWEMPPESLEKFDHVDAVNYRRFFDTSREGYSNRGARTCGPNLKSKKNKDAVIEFLKSLSDETVLPEGTRSEWGRALLEVPSGI